MPGSREDVAARLQAELVRLSQLAGTSPFAVLGLGNDAVDAEIRSAFLAATKQFHPNRFALEAVSVRDLAHEVFLVIRKAYDQLKTPERRERARMSRRVPPTQPPGSTVRPPAVTPPVRSSFPTPTPPPRRVATTPSPRGHLNVPRGATPPVGKVNTPPPASRIRTSMTPPIGRSATDVEAMLAQVRSRGQRIDEATAMIAAGKYRLAREALHGIAAEDPANRRARVQLHLAWGLEYRAEDRLDEAERELERAIGLDPECVAAHTALREIAEARKRGILSKIFGR